MEHFNILVLYVLENVKTYWDNILKMFAMVFAEGILKYITNRNPRFYFHWVMKSLNQYCPKDYT
jgi:hypothetical protein